MYFHENIFSLILVICFAGLVYPYFMKGSAGLIRLTSVYRPTSLSSFFLYALVIALQPGLGRGALVAVPFLAMNGICCMAMELRALDRKAVEPSQLALADVGGQIRKTFFILAGILLCFAVIAPLPIDLAAVCVNLMLAFGFGWAACEALFLYSRHPSFNLLTTLISCGVASICMIRRAAIYIDTYGGAQSMVFPEPDSAFLPRVIASFGVVMAAIAFNYEYLGRLADHERGRAERLDERLFATLSRILERRTRRPSDLSLLFGECAYLLATRLVEARWDQVRHEPDLAALVRRCAPVADIGMIAVPDHGTAAPERRQLVAQHSFIGQNFFSAINAGRARSGDMTRGRHAIVTAAEVAGSYSEHWDGSGAPLGLRDTQIPVAARIVSVARAYVVAMWTKRRTAGRQAALEEVKAGRGTLYDPVIVDALLAAEPEMAELFDDLIYRVAA